MYAIDEGLAMVNGEVVETFERDIDEGHTKIEVEVGTTGYKGSTSRAAGGRTYLRLFCESGDFYFRSIKEEDGSIRGITIACCGDEALTAVMKAVGFVQQAISDQCCEVDD